MHPRNSLLVALSLASVPVLADIVVFGVPAIIKPGQAFNASFQWASEQPRQDIMFWGYTHYKESDPAGYMPQHNTVGGAPMARLNVQDYLAVAQGGWNGNITDLKIDGNVGDKVGVHVMIWGQYGVVNSVTIHSWMWNVTLGEATSYGNYIMASKGSSSSPNFKSFTLSDIE